MAFQLKILLNGGSIDLCSNDDNNDGSLNDNAVPNSQDNSVVFVDEYSLPAEAVSGQASATEIIDLTSSVVSPPSETRIRGQRKRKSTNSDCELIGTVKESPTYGTSSKHKSPDITCPICLDTVLNKRPMSTFCGHIFCYNCITTEIRIRKKCPNCKQPLNAKKIHPIFIN